MTFEDWMETQCAVSFSFDDLFIIGMHDELVYVKEWYFSDFVDNEICIIKMKPTVFKKSLEMFLMKKADNWGEHMWLTATDFCQTGTMDVAVKGKDIPYKVFEDKVFKIGMLEN